MSTDDLKRQAALEAAKLIEPGMRLGLGTGSTAKHLVDAVGKMVAEGLKVVCVPTSEGTRKQAESLGIPLTTLDDTPELDLTIDGADEFDPSLRLIKGGGGALVREKIVAVASTRMVVITDVSKEVPALGRFPLPIEVNPFGLESTRRQILKVFTAAGYDCPAVLRRSPTGGVYVTDGGHYILDCPLGEISDPEALSMALFQVPGVVEHGLFLGLAKAVIVADDTGLRIIGNPA